VEPLPVAPTSTGVRSVLTLPGSRPVAVDRSTMSPGPWEIRSDRPERSICAGVADAGLTFDTGRYSHPDTATVAGSGERHRDLLARREIPGASSWLYRRSVALPRQ
jgi:hypothetical protein